VARVTAVGRLGRSSIIALAVVAAGLLLAFGGIAAARPDGWTRITVLDVGQGDAILIEGASGGRVLIDGGPDPDRLRALLDARVPAWDRRIDVVVLTHPHEDHAAGLVGLIGRYRIGHFFEPGMAGRGPGYVALAGLLDKTGQPRGRLATGDRFTVDAGVFGVLWPDPGSVPAEAPDDGTGINNVSIVLQLTVGRRTFLLMGDVEQGIDPILLGRGMARADVLKVAHHGSGTATTQPFLDAVRPRVAVVSVGAKNRYGHPNRQTIARLEGAADRVFRTDQDGSVTIATDGSTLRLSARREAAIDASRTARAKAGITRARTARSGTWPRVASTDGRPRARRGGVRPPRARSAGMVRPPLHGSRRGGGVSRRTSRRSGLHPRSPPRRNGRPAARCRQGASEVRPGAPPAAWARLGRLAGTARVRRARGGGHRASRHATADGRPRR
jgi:competence protein ComEC